MAEGRGGIDQREPTTPKAASASRQPTRGIIARCIRADRASLPRNRARDIDISLEADIATAPQWALNAAGGHPGHTVMVERPGMQDNAARRDAAIASSSSAWRHTEVALALDRISLRCRAELSSHRAIGSPASQTARPESTA